MRSVRYVLFECCASCCVTHCELCARYIYASCIQSSTLLCFCVFVVPAVFYGGPGLNPDTIAFFLPVLIPSSLSPITFVLTLQAVDPDGQYLDEDSEVKE